jgi:hypothetical protein
MKRGGGGGRYNSVSYLHGRHFVTTAFVRLPEDLILPKTNENKVFWNRYAVFNYQSPVNIFSNFELKLMGGGGGLVELRRLKN